MDLETLVRFLRVLNFVSSGLLVTSDIFVSPVQSIPVHLSPVISYTS